MTGRAGDAGDGRPRLRPLEVFSTTHDGRPVVALRDPTGATDSVALLPPPLAAVVAFMDGSRTVAEIEAEVAARTGHHLPPDTIAEIARRLDEALLLDSDAFRAHAAVVERRFLQSPTRPAAHAGRSYPASAAELNPMIDRFFSAGRSPRPLPRGLIAPHIDFGRGASAYGRAYAPLLGAPPADLFVVFGTDHNGGDFRFTLTRKHYVTPAGPVRTDGSLVDEMVGRLGGARLFHDEIHHRFEHSIEFQAVMLRHAFPSADLCVLPVLCGSMHRFVADGRDPRHDAEAERFFEALAESTRGRRVCFVAGADLAHVGPRFGDRRPLGKAAREALLESDTALLDHAAAGDGAAFFSAIAEVRDRNRVCGTSAIYALLRMLEGARGRVVAYDQCAADDEGGSLVSIASVVFPD
jgi:hypothetical protein